MAPHICIFEDDHFAQFLPLVHFRPVYALRCGIFSLKEKISRVYPRANVAIQCRKSLALCIKFRKPQFSVNEIPAAECLFINGRVLADQTLAKNIPITSKEDVVYVSNGQVIAAYVSGANLDRIKKNLSSPLSHSSFDGLPIIEIDVETVSYPWDLIQKNGAQIVKDFESIAEKSREEAIPHSRENTPWRAFIRKEKRHNRKWRRHQSRRSDRCRSRPESIWQGCKNIGSIHYYRTGMYFGRSLIKVGAQIYGTRPSGLYVKSVVK